MNDNFAALNRAKDAWNNGDLDGYLTLYADDLKLHGYTPETMDKPAAVEFYRHAIWNAFPNPKLQFEDMMSDGDKVICRFTMTGTHKGPFMGLPPTGVDIALPGITILRFASGKCVERWSQADMLASSSRSAPPGPGLALSAERAHIHRHTPAGLTTRGIGVLGALVVPSVPSWFPAPSAPNQHVQRLTPQPAPPHTAAVVPVASPERKAAAFIPQDICR